MALRRAAMTGIGEMLAVPVQQVIACAEHGIRVGQHRLGRQGAGIEGAIFPPLHERAPAAHAGAARVAGIGDHHGHAVRAFAVADQGEMMRQLEQPFHLHGDDRAGAKALRRNGGHRRDLPEKGRGP